MYKRLKEGKLTIFLFYVTHRKTTLFGKNKILRGEPYGHVPVSECRAWRAELEERAVAQGRITQEELEGSKPDWHGEFLRWQNKKERWGLKEHMVDMDMTYSELVTGLSKAWIDVVKEEFTKAKPSKPKK
ncbi:MAG: hypothetical protein ACKV19_06335 [Verrucomicrobiales bacterium]